MRSPRGFLPAPLALALLGAIFSAGAFAQQTTGSILGSVIDAQGGAVVGAPVEVRNTDTGLSRSTSTNDHGEYRVDFLPPGTYEIGVKAAGFRAFRQTGVSLAVGQFARVDAHVEIGETTNTITVEGGAPLVNTTDATVGQTVDTQQITTLPIVNRSVYSLLNLTPGVQNTSTAITLGFPAQRTFINGGSDATMGSVNYYLDGGSNVSSLRNTGNTPPNPDAVQEFRVETNNYSAEYGRFGNGVINVITRSGTNQLHGSLFEFLRNTDLNANTYNALSKPPLHRNQFGGSFGGPIIRNKTFFFGTYSGLRQQTTTFLSSAVVPTAAQRSGDFSAIAKAIVDPTTGQPFPGNAIPVSRMDPTALNIMNKHLPLANFTNNTFQGQVPSPYNTDEFLIKLDHSVTDSQRLSASYYTTAGTNTISPGGNLPWSTQTFNWRQQNANMQYTWTMSPALVNQTWLSYTRYFGGRLNLPAISLHDLGSDFNIQGPPNLPQIAVTGYFTFGQSISGPVAGDNVYSIRNVTSYTRGRHTIRFGGELSLSKDIQQTLLNNYGTFSFTGAKTGPKTNQGDGFADFLLGLPVTMNQDAPETALYNFWQTGIFVQDDVKLLPRLTVNLGLRYDLQTPPTDPQNREQTFVPGAQSQVLPGAPAGVLVVGDPGVARGVVTMRKNHVSPRIGLAWDPFGDGKTSIRAGGGIFYGSVSGNGWGTVENSQPFAVRQQFASPASLTHPYANLPGGVSPFPYVYTPATARFILPAGLLPIDLNFLWPRSYQFNFTIQRQVLKDLSVSAGYVGTLSHHLAFSPDINYPFYTANATSSNYNSRRPYGNGQLSTINLMQSNGTASYHALQLNMKKSMARHFSLTAFYTFSKSLASAQMDGQSTNGGAQDFRNLALEHGRSDYDQRHNFVAALIWDVSYYRGSNQAIRWLFNGWTVSPIVNLGSGLPFTVTTGKDNNYDGQSNDRANLIGNPYLDPNRSRAAVAAEWFNIAAFGPNPIGTDGTSARNLLDGPGFRNIDMGLFRDFTIHERMKMQFRAEFTNFFNMVSLNAPNAALSSSSFGRITSAREMRQLQLGLRLAW
ncbi:MAG: TonB-dependent receptor [Acidobacteria bacterium]|nr:TonB-dependent receptor [Acidobacteriota bacterium]